MWLKILFDSKIKLTQVNKMFCYPLEKFGLFSKKNLNMSIRKWESIFMILNCVRLFYKYSSHLLETYNYVSIQIIIILIIINENVWTQLIKVQSLRNINTHKYKLNIYIKKITKLISN